MNDRPRAWILELGAETWRDPASGLLYCAGRCACCERCWVVVGPEHAHCLYNGPFEDYVAADVVRRPILT